MENITEKWLLFDTLSNLVMEVNPDYDRSDEIFRFGLRIILHFYSLPVRSQVTLDFSSWLRNVAL